MRIYCRARPQGLGDASGCVASGGIAVKEKKDARGLREPCELIVEELSAKERYSIGNACLAQAHGCPGTFDYNDAFMAEWLCPVGIVEDVRLGEVFGKAPFAEPCDLIAQEQAGTVAKWTRLDIMQPYGNAVFKERGALSGACFEEPGGNGRDLFNSLEKVRLRIEGNGASEGLKGRTIRSSIWSPDSVQR